MRSTLDVDPAALGEVLVILDQFAVSVVGSAKSEELGTVTLIVDGQIVPDTPKVTRTIERMIGERAGTLTARFKPA